MNKEDIIRMAKQAGYYTDDEDVYDGSNFFIHTKEITKFAELVAAHECEKLKNVAIYGMWLKERDLAIEAAVLAEREACAKVCEKRETSYQYATDPWALEHIMEAQYCATDIRARGKE